MMSAIFDIGKVAIPIALEVARYFIEKKVAEGGITPEEQASVDFFNALVVFINAQK